MEKITQSAAILKVAASEINALLATDHSTINSNVQVSLNKIINRLNFFSGTGVGAGSSAESHKPVTRFMGTVLTPTAELTDEDLIPADTEVQDLTEKVNKLYEVIQDFDPSVVLNSYANAANELVLRGVAKKAGIKDYDEVPLNIPLIDQIVQAKKDTAEQKISEADIEAQLAAQQQLFSEGAPDTNPPAEENPVSETEQDVQAKKDTAEGLEQVSKEFDQIKKDKSQAVSKQEVKKGGPKSKK